MIRRILKWFFWLCLALALLFVVALFTARWWIPRLINELLPSQLVRFEQADGEVRLTNIDLTGLSAVASQLRHSDVVIERADIELSYTPQSLENGQLNALVIKDSRTRVDLLRLIETLRAPTAPEEPPTTAAVEIPFQHAAIENGQINLTAGSWSNSVTSNLHFAQQGPTNQLLLNARAPGALLAVRAAFTYPDLSGNIRGRVALDSIMPWLGVAQALSSEALPEIQSAALDLEIVTEIADAGSDYRFPFELRASVGDINAETSAVRVEADRLEISLDGRDSSTWPSEISLENGSLHWSGDTGHLEGVRGDIQLKSVSPPVTPSRQSLVFSTLTQGDIIAQDGRITFSISGGESPLIDASIEARIFDGNITARIAGETARSDAFDVTIDLDSVDLGRISSLLPDFEGKVEGIASGRLTARWENGALTLRPGFLEMNAGTEGQFSYYRRGWLTQDPNLDPAQFVAGKDIVQVMETPCGASILTELALRDLRMTKFRIDLLNPDQGDRRMMIQLEGSGEVKGIEVPVLLDVPIRGQLKEYINLMLKLQNRM